MVNLFKSAVNQVNNDLNKQQKKDLYDQTKMYIFLQDFIEQIKKQLDEGEEISAYLPLTSDGENASVVGSGLLGMYHPKTEAAKAYLKEFNDLRGNRVLIFTNHRMIYTTIIEFLDHQPVFSYPYETIKAITLKQNKASYFNWNNFKPTRSFLSTYTFDFESENHIFSELLSERDADILKRQLAEIPLLKTILVTDTIYRKKRFDQVVNNPVLAYRLVLYFSIGAAVLFLFFLALGGIFHFGPAKSLFDFGSSSMLYSLNVFH
ncbi:hypothetical protein [Enterococcus wangshanyuanii]|uniref:YokE-like PH domain-containing protein n=1 Tax=Enterococcus wangshanyuanii TaxID=2005703 RepID=A0ABQ1NY28_9ENTE|nr:hypothetical protein [Enterococcus wangshanyuanii]GGC82881.1 hypothetical protein GCM10011573_10640 [Enterococcus wangshanyuanii]